MVTTTPVDSPQTGHPYSFVALRAPGVPRPVTPQCDSFRISFHDYIHRRGEQVQSVHEDRDSNVGISSGSQAAGQWADVLLPADSSCLSNARRLRDDATDVRWHDTLLLLKSWPTLWSGTKPYRYDLNGGLQYAPYVKQEPARAKPPIPSDLVLSAEFLSRILKFVAWAPGWDGERAEHIDHVTAVRAMEAASSMRPVVSEPFVAPAPSGALLLQWDFTDGSSVEVYVDDETEFPASAALTDDDIVYEIDLSGPGALRSLLAKRGNISATT